MLLILTKFEKSNTLEKPRLLRNHNFSLSRQLEILILHFESTTSFFMNWIEETAVNSFICLPNPVHKVKNLYGFCVLIHNLLALEKTFQILVKKLMLAAIFFKYMTYLMKNSFIHVLRHISQQSKSLEDKFFTKFRP